MERHILRQMTAVSRKLSPDIRQRFQMVSGRDRIRVRPVPTLGGMHQAFAELRSVATTTQSPTASLVEIYQTIGNFLPYHTRGAIHRLITETLKTGTEEDKAQAREVALDLNIRSALNGIRPFQTGNRDLDDEQLQEVLIRMHRSIDSIYITKVAPQLRGAVVFTTARRLAMSYILDQYPMSANLITSFPNDKKEQTLGSQLFAVTRAVDRLFHDYPLGLPPAQVAIESARISAEIRVDEEALTHYIARQNRAVHFPAGEGNARAFEVIVDYASTDDLNFLRELIQSGSIGNLADKRGVSGSLISLSRQRITSRVGQNISKGRMVEEHKIAPLGKKTFADRLQENIKANNVEVRRVPLAWNDHHQWIHGILSGDIKGISAKAVVHFVNAAGHTDLSSPEAKSLLKEAWRERVDRWLEPKKENHRELSLAFVETLRDNIHLLRKFSYPDLVTGFIYGTGVILEDVGQKFDVDKKYPIGNCDPFTNSEVIPVDQLIMDVFGWEMSDPRARLLTHKASALMRKMRRKRKSNITSSQIPHEQHYSGGEEATVSENNVESAPQPDQKSETPPTLDRANLPQLPSSHQNEVAEVTASSKEPKLNLITNTFRQRLSEVMQVNGISIYQLAEASGVDQFVIDDILTGELRGSDMAISDRIIATIARLEPTSQETIQSLAREATREQMEKELAGKTTLTKVALREISSTIVNLDMHGLAALEPLACHELFCAYRVANRQTIESAARALNISPTQYRMIEQGAIYTIPIAAVIENVFGRTETDPLIEILIRKYEQVRPRKKFRQSQSL